MGEKAICPDRSHSSRRRRLGLVAAAAFAASAGLCGVSQAQVSGAPPVNGPPVPGVPLGGGAPIPIVPFGGGPPVPGLPLGGGQLPPPVTSSPPVTGAPILGPQISGPPAPVPLLPYCAPPIVPSCVDAAVTYKSARAIASCRTSVDSYVTTVFHYRECVARETDRAVLETNQTLQRFRCSMQRKQPCPPNQK
jgi:hypothetical protein